MEFGIQLTESGIPLTIESRIQVPLAKTGIQYLGSRIHGMESRIQGCLGFLLHGANRKVILRQE